MRIDRRGALAMLARRSVIDRFVVLWVLCRHWSSRTDASRRRSHSRSESEQQEQRDQQREDAERLGHREAENQVAKLALRGRRVAQRGGEIMTENGTDADAGATHADAGNAGANHFCGL